MILWGWKEIAKYLGCGVRTAQRWEKEGLPVRRPVPGKRAHVVTESEQLDLWVRDSAFRRSYNAERSAAIERARILREEVKRARETLHLKMEQLRKELGLLRAQTKTLSKRGLSRRSHG